MKLFLFLSIFSLVLFSALAGFTDITITYQSGDCRVDKDGNGRWVKAALDMELNERSAVRTGRDGSLEILFDDETVVVGNSSTVKISELQAQLKERKKSGWLAGIQKYTKTIAKGEGKHSSTALAGVRGEAVGGDEIEWFDEEAESPVIEEEYVKGKELFNEGRYAEAVTVFSSLIESEEAAPVADELSFYLGVSLFNSLRYREALPYLEESCSSGSGELYEPALFHLALCQYMLENYDEAIAGFKRYRREFPNGELEPYVLLMLGKACKKTGNPDEAKQYLLEVRRIYADTEVAQYAYDELKEL